MKRLGRLSLVFLALALAACGEGEKHQVDASTSDGGPDAAVFPDGGGQADLMIQGMAFLAPYGEKLEIPPDKEIAIGLYASLDETGLLPADDGPPPFSLSTAAPDGSFSTTAPPDCSVNLLAFTFTKGTAIPERPPRGSVVGAYAANPVCSANEKANIFIDHYTPGANADSGISYWKKEAVIKSVEALVGNPYIDFASYREGDVIHVFSARGNIELRRDGGGIFDVTVKSGKNPFKADSTSALSTYFWELSAGSNPEGTQIPGYPSGDPRISFIEPEKTSYPLWQERLWQVFEDDRCGDIVTFPVPYGSGYQGAVGEHGSMDITQSRTVLVFSGAGTVKGSITNYAGRAVDVAPTILKILGAEKTAGIDLAGRFKSGLYMKWQDGIALDDVMNGDRAENAVLFVFDGLSFTELKRALDNDDPKLPAFKEIIANGTFFNYGAVSNYPSISLPGHMTVGTGVYSGHHGLANNIFYDRVFDTVENIITAGAATARLQRPWTETIFEAAARSFGLWDERRQKGAFYASINEMIMRGAQYSSFANIFNYSKQAFSEELPVTKGYETYSGADNTAVKQFIYLYERGELPIPKITAVNIALIDFISHGHGPHGDLTRQALADTDVRLGRMLKALRNAGIYEKTLIVLTGDHGQELQDRKRSLEYHIVNNEFRVPVLDVLGIKYIGAAPFMYLKTMELLVEPKSPAPGTTLDITVAVRNEDTGKALPDVNVKLVNGIATVPVCVTDQTGSCTIKDVTLTAPLGILAAHKDFNPATYP